MIPALISEGLVAARRILKWLELAYQETEEVRTAYSLYQAISSAFKSEQIAEDTIKVTKRLFITFKLCR